MMLIGTSFGGCLQSIMLGEVSKEDVLVIISRTRMRTLADVVQVVEDYHANGNHWATVPGNYSKLAEFDLADVLRLACDLYEAGKIHQPQNFTENPEFVHPNLKRTKIWLEVVPKSDTHHHSVLDAYNKYKMVAALIK